MLAWACALTMSLTLAAQHRVETECTKQSFNHKGIEREYWVFVPEHISDDGALLVCLHGHGGRARHENGHLLDLAREHGFVVCYPQGLKDGKDKTSWNVGYPFQKDMKINDVDFLEKLVRHIQRSYGLQKDNAFLTGMSNGGEMCYLMALKRPQLFAGIMSIAGLTLVDMQPLNYKRPVPFMEVHGTKDRVSLWEGDPTNQYGWGAYLGVPAAVSYVVAGDKCISYSREELPLTGKNQVVLHRYFDGAPVRKGGHKAEVWFYEVQGGGHNWADKSMDTYGEMWRFMDHFMNRQ